MQLVKNSTFRSVKPLKGERQQFTYMIQLYLAEKMNAKNPETLHYFT